MILFSPFYAGQTLCPPPCHGIGSETVVQTSGIFSACSLENQAKRPPLKIVWFQTVKSGRLSRDAFTFYFIFFRLRPQESSSRAEHSSHCDIPHPHPQEFFSHPTSPTLLINSMKENICSDPPPQSSENSTCLGFSS